MARLKLLALCWRDGSHQPLWRNLGHECTCFASWFYLTSRPRACPWAFSSWPQQASISELALRGRSLPRQQIGIETPHFTRWPCPSTRDGELSTPSAMQASTTSSAGERDCPAGFAGTAPPPARRISRSRLVAGIARPRAPMSGESGDVVVMLGSSDDEPPSPASKRTRDDDDMEDELAMDAEEAELMARMAKRRPRPTTIAAAARPPRAAAAPGQPQPHLAPRTVARAASAPTVAPPRAGDAVPSQLGRAASARQASAADKRTQKHWARQEAGAFASREVTCVLPAILADRALALAEGVDGVAAAVAKAFDEDPKGHRFAASGAAGARIAGVPGLVAWTRR